MGILSFVRSGRWGKKTTTLTWLKRGLSFRVQMPRHLPAPAGRKKTAATAVLAAPSGSLLLRLHPTGILSAVTGGPLPVIARGVTVTGMERLALGGCEAPLPWLTGFSDHCLWEHWGG